MPAIKKLYDYFEQYTGRKLIGLLLGIGLLFLSVGVVVGQLGKYLVPESGGTQPDNTYQTPAQIINEQSGRVVYVSPDLYPNENITYKLVDEAGKDVVLLRASDDKLKFVEGGRVKLAGRMTKTRDGNHDVFEVDKIVFK